jgi:8-oxo-dGTP diphosphatase
MTECTLLFLAKDNQVLLARKKRGVGEGYWNGVGGKLEPGESWEEAVVRECQEEICVTPIDFELRGTLTFDFYHKDERQDMYGQVYVCTKWEGKPKETEEMRPKWFNLEDIPLDKMWDDDKYWLHELLNGKTVEAFFKLNEKHVVVEHRVEFDKKLTLHNN